jgi:hypothetical protein
MYIVQSSSHHANELFISTKIPISVRWAESIGCNGMDCGLAGLTGLWQEGGLRVAIRVYSRFWCAAAATSADYSMANGMDDGKYCCYCWVLGGWRRGGSGWVDIVWMGDVDGGRKGET